MRDYYLERQIKFNKENRDRLLSLEHLSEKQKKELELVKAIIKLQEKKLNSLKS
tara:strand:- start:1755 stop:1916 length:162 start_codon:yes stop_codon:yes gene_type:complete